MVLFIGYHATARRNRSSIQAHGLSIDFSRCHRPGVYVFDPHMANYSDDWSTAERCGWSFGGRLDVWRVAYCGPMTLDPALTNAVILPSVQDVTLVTGNA